METRAQRNRAIRQDALREQLAAGGHLQHVIEVAGKLSDPANVIEPDMVQRYKIVIDTKLKLINKYLPDLKNVELTTEDGGAPKLEVTVKYV